ncbi:hypothetical protein [Haloferula sp. BvORR071]|uniref:hypothetical protein n=1 Tax=Haloferula sp. BvORR071 TaxID=1396141 RepID=UPI0005537A41|nr:hypothetical protein [Haloferula sp. BvORR071]
MIEHLRKYTGLIIFVIALLFVGLAFFGDRASMGHSSPTNPVVLTVDGTSYNATHYRKLAEVPIALVMNQDTMGMTFQLGLYQYVGELDGLGDEQGARRFFINRLNLRDAAQDFGIDPSPDEIKARVQKAFVKQAVLDKDGAIKSPEAFDQEAYNEFVKQLPRFGMQEKDLLDLVNDILATEKLKEILGGSLAGSRSFAAESGASSEQQVTIQTARTALATFQEKITPTDEELKAAWETTKEKYMVERKIKVSYLLAKPQYPERKVEPPKLPTAVTEEAKKEEEKAEADKKAKEDAEYAATKRAIDDEVLSKIETILTGIQNSEGKDFEKLATENGWQLVATDFIQRSALPPELAISTAETRPVPVGDYLFRLTSSKEPLTAFTEALQLKDNAYLIARLDASEDERPKTFEEAKDQVKTDYIANKANEELKKDADDKAAKIREGLKAGKPFADVAKELGLEPKSLAAFKATDTVPGEPDVSSLFQTAATVDPGSLADPVIKPDSALFIFVEKRELVKDDKRNERIDQNVKQQANAMQSFTLRSWLRERLEATKVEDPRAKGKH